MVISNNVPALKIHTNLLRNDRLLKTSMQRLATGFRINSAKEDAAGLAIANKLTFQITGLYRASENAAHGISLVQTADGAMTEIHNMLQRMREIGVYAAHDVLTNEDRKKIQDEMDELLDEINLIATRTEFNKIKILSGEADKVHSSLNRTGVTDPDPGEVDRTVARMLYMSDKVPPGNFNYTIESVGTPPVVSLPLPPLTSLPASLPEGTLFINGTQIRVNAGATPQSIMFQITQLCAEEGIDCSLEEVSGNTLLHLAGKTAGSKYGIEIIGSPALLSALGMPTNGLSVTGGDAIITKAEMRDENGNPVTSFNSGMAIKADGNQVNVIGTNGEQIRFNIQVLRKSDPVTGKYLVPPEFTYGNGESPAADGVTVTTDMTFDIKSYGPIMLQIGQNYNNAMAVQIPKLNAETLGLVEFKGGRMFKLIGYHNQKAASMAIDIADAAIQMTSTVRSRLGAFQNRLESTIRSLDQAVENTETSRSIIRDTDMAKESTAYAQRNIMYQAGLAILAQANQRPQQIISLL